MQFRSLVAWPECTKIKRFCFEKKSGVTNKETQRRGSSNTFLLCISFSSKTIIENERWNYLLHYANRLNEFLQTRITQSHIRLFAIQWKWNVSVQSRLENYAPVFRDNSRLLAATTKKIFRCCTMNKIFSMKSLSQKKYIIRPDSKIFSKKQVDVYVA